MHQQHDETTEHFEPTQARHPELARRIALAVASYRAGVSYATQEKRMAEDGLSFDPSWYRVADKLMHAVDEAVSERLLTLFG